MNERLPWFRCYPSKLLGALSAMEPDVGYVYTIALLRIYEVDGPINDTAATLARRSGLSAPRVKRALETLFESGKLITKDGMISNPIAEDNIHERADFLEARSEAGKKGAKVRWEKNKQIQQNGDGRAMLADSHIHLQEQSKRKRKTKSHSRVDEPPEVKKAKPKAKPKPNAHAYSERFEREVWEPYPRKKGTSKIAAFKKFEALSEADQATVIKTIPIYAQLKKGKDEEHMHHLEFFISKRIFDTLSVSAPATANPDWLNSATRTQWAQILKIWRSDQNWRASWGPAPGKPGCHVPSDMLFPGENQ